MLQLHNLYKTKDYLISNKLTLSFIIVSHKELPLLQDIILNGRNNTTFIFVEASLSILTKLFSTYQNHLVSLLDEYVYSTLTVKNHLILNPFYRFKIFVYKEYKIASITGLVILPIYRGYIPSQSFIKLFTYNA